MARIDRLRQSAEVWKIMNKIFETHKMNHLRNRRLNSFKILNAYEQVTYDLETRARKEAWRLQTLRR